MWEPRINDKSQRGAHVVPHGPAADLPGFATFSAHRIWAPGHKRTRVLPLYGWVSAFRAAVSPCGVSVLLDVDGLAGWSVKCRGGAAIGCCGA